MWKEKRASSKKLILRNLNYFKKSFCLIQIFIFILNRELIILMMKLPHLDAQMKLTVSVQILFLFFLLRLLCVKCQSVIYSQAEQQQNHPKIDRDSF
jgi:hypothetical protein